MDDSYYSSLLVAEFEQILPSMGVLFISNFEYLQRRRQVSRKHLRWRVLQSSLS